MWHTWRSLMISQWLKLDHLHSSLPSEVLKKRGGALVWNILQLLYTNVRLLPWLRHLCFRLLEFWGSKKRNKANAISVGNSHVAGAEVETTSVWTGFRKAKGETWASGCNTLFTANAPSRHQKKRSNAFQTYEWRAHVSSLPGLIWIKYSESPGKYKECGGLCILPLWTLD